MSRLFRFGCQAYSPNNGTEWFDTARKAEDLGYSTLHVADHYFGPGPAMEEASHPLQTVACIPAMMAAATTTESIKIGSRVICVDYHHPVVLAKELATIDLLSDGRLEAGFGAGWVASEYTAMGIPMDRPGVRIDRMVEVVEMSRSFFAGEVLDVEGEHVTAKDMQAVPSSPQKAGPRIMIGGGSARVLRTAGRLADIVSINFDNSAGKIGSHGIGSGTADGTAQKLAWIREGAGDRFDELEVEIGAYFTTVTDQSAATTETMAKGLGLTTEALASHPHTLIGSIDEICEKLEQRRDELGISYVTVGVSAIEDFAPVVERMTGR
ncbi:MAG: TIGR03621 family F420-dependent LLM class oxidoreductase [Actinomycetota bacterium]|nr:TIGR03621 family F420-dependent LLM class oxidoreductase [Actinomycetota bacterium]